MEHKPAPKRKRYPKGPAKPGEVRPPRGRATIYTPEIAEEVLRRIASGEVLVSVCKSDHLPSAETIWNWSEEDRRPNDVPATFIADFARARRIGHDAIAMDALRIADNTHVGVETTTKADGSIEERRGDMLGHRKLQVETRLKLLAKWDRRYADSLKQEVTGADGGPLEVRNIGDADLEAKIADLLLKAGKA